MLEKEIPMMPEVGVPVSRSELDSLRVKVTDRCQWQCAFCHNEGNIATTDLQWGPETKEIFDILRKVLPTLREVHFTGGEPTSDPELASITAGLTAMGFEVKTTTNGQFSSDTLDKLIKAGLKSFNFSIHSFNPERFLRFQLGRGVWWQEKGKKSGEALPSSKISPVKMEKISWAQQQIDRQLRMILETRNKGVDVKINTVISALADIENAKEIFEWGREHSIPVALLNDLGNRLEAIEAIREFVRGLDAKEVLRKVTVGLSSCSTVYRTDDGYEFVVKQIRDQKLESMCQACPRREDGSCEEQFYGIRLQKGQDGQYYVILCVQESRPETQMTLEKFIESDQLKEIQQYITYL